MDLYKSRNNLSRVITNLNLHISIEGLQEDEQLEVEIIEDNTPENKTKLTLKYSNEEFEIQDKDNNVTKKFSLGEVVSQNGLSFKINNFKFMKPEKELKLDYQKVSSYLDKLSTISLNSKQRNSFYGADGIINVSLFTSDIESGKQILNEANRQFIEFNLETEKQKAQKAIDFINKNLESVREISLISKRNLTGFLEDNESINVELQIAAIVDKVTALEEEIGKIDIEIAKAKELYVVGNPMLTKLEAQKDILLAQRSAVQKDIKLLPREQQQTIDLLQKVEVEQSLLESLEEQKLNYSIMEASTIGNIRIIDNAYVEMRVSPSLLFVFFATVIGFVASFVFAIYRGNYLLPISNPAELFDADIKLNLLSVVPELNAEDIKAESIENSVEDARFRESINSMVVNIESLLESRDIEKKAIKISISSATPSNGKSLISRNTALGLVALGKKVLFIDLDLKKGGQNKIFKKETISEQEFYNINTANLEQLKLKENFYFIPRVSKTRDSFNFIYQKSYKDKIDELSLEFDYIIFDTPPLLALPESSLICTRSDFVFMVVRHSLTRINEIRQLITSLEQVNKGIDGIVYNCYAKPKSYYGFYGAYGNYAYQYYAKKYLYGEYDYENRN